MASMRQTGPKPGQKGETLKDQNTGEIDGLREVLERLIEAGNKIVYQAHRESILTNEMVDRIDEFHEVLKQASGFRTEEDGVEIIRKERTRQLEKGYDAKHDAEKNTVGQLAMAASCYAMSPARRDLLGPISWYPSFAWPWGFHRWKPSIDDRIRELAIGGALCAAEIDRYKISGFKMSGEMYMDEAKARHEI